MTHHSLDEVRVRDGLRELARADAPLAAPPRVERALLRAWDAHHAQTSPAERAPARARVYPAWWTHQRLTRAAASALAAGVVWAAIVGISDRKSPDPADDLPPKAAATPPRAAVVPDAAIAAALGSDRPQRPLAARASRRAVSAAGVSASAGPPFGGTTLVLVDEPVGPGERVHVVRMRVVREALGSFGTAAPGGGDMVDVDVVVGEDGVARTLTFGM